MTGTDIVAALRAARLSGDGRGIADILDHTPNPVAEALGLEVLECLASDDHRVRNPAAVALTELKVPGAEAALRAALVRPGVARQSGTLVWSLHEMGGRISPAEAVHVVEHGSHEARLMLSEMVADGMLDLSDRAALPAALSRLDELDEDCGEVGVAASEVLASLQRAGVAELRPW